MFTVSSSALVHITRHAPAIPTYGDVDVVAGGGVAVKHCDDDCDYDDYCNC